MTEYIIETQIWSCNILINTEGYIVSSGKSCQWALNQRYMKLAKWLDRVIGVGNWKRIEQGKLNGIS